MIFKNRDIVEKPAVRTFGWDFLVGLFLDGNFSSVNWKDSVDGQQPR
jgi:hypothetical protein